MVEATVALAPAHMKRGRMSHRDDRWTKLLVLFLSIVISLSGAELLLRTIGYYGLRGATLENLVLVEDDVLDYRRIPNTSWIRNNIRYDINQHGWQDYHYEYQKPENTFRIVVVGDSVTNGHGVQLDDTYAKQLERQLNNKVVSNLNYEVLALSLGALNSVQEAHLLEVEGIKYDPDLIVIGYVLNDPAPGASLRAQRRKHERLLPRIKGAASRSSIVHYAYKAGKRIWWKIAVVMRLEQTAEYIHQDYFSALHQDPKKWNEVVGALERIKKLSEPREVPVVLALFPILYQLDDYRWTEVHQQVRDAAEQNGIDVLDLLERFKRHRQADLQVDNGDHVHPNALGHRVAASALFDFLVSRRLLAPRDAISPLTPPASPR